MVTARLHSDDKALIKRYLVWCYKTTKESLDRIDRKFTQLSVDRYILKQFSKKSPRMIPKAQTRYRELLKEFQDYIAQKEKAALSEKFNDKQSKILKDDYVFLHQRLSAVEKAIVHFLGKKELPIIKSLYQQEMVHRILTATEHI